MPCFMRHTMNGATPSTESYAKYYKGKAAAPVIPSVFAAYKKGDWTISGFFAITGGGGKASFDERVCLCLSH